MLTLILAVVAGCLWMAAQRHITPVQPGRPQPAANERPTDLTKLAHHMDRDGNMVLVDTVTGLEVADTLIARVPKMQYPLLHSVSVGVNIWDAAMRLFGQKYGLADLSLSVGLHNRYFPTFEAGLSTALATPSGLNYTFRSPLAPYFKIGADYNFFYNSNPAYKLMAGVRYGITRFSYSYTDVTIDDTYWGTDAAVEIPPQSATAGYLELLLNIRVKIGGPVSMGWAFKYHTLLHQTSAPGGKALAVPGYGKQAGSITGAFSIFYTFTLNQPAAPIVDTKN